MPTLTTGQVLQTDHSRISNMPQCTFHQFLKELLSWSGDLIRAGKTVVIGALVGIAKGIRKLAQWLGAACKWLGPFAPICKLLTKVLEGLATSTEATARIVVEGIFRFIERAVELLNWLLGWIIWVIMWVFRGLDYLVCRNEAEHATRRLRMCVRIFVDENDPANTVIDPAAAHQIMRIAFDLLMGSCQIEIHWTIQTFPVPTRWLTQPLDCSVGGLLTDEMVLALHRRAEPCCLTVYFVGDVSPNGTRGCQFPGTEWVAVRAAPPGQTPRNIAANLLHEFGHAADLTHSSATGNFMDDGNGDAITEQQCCMLRSSRFVVP